MSIDPSHYLPGANGGRPPLLKLQNISARPELNGQFGQAVSFSAGRYVVAILDAATAAATAGGGDVQPTMLKLKPENLAEAGHVDQLKFGAGMMFQTAKAYVAGPTMQGWGQQLIDRLPPAVQSKMTPNMALAGAAIAAQLSLFLVYLILGRFIGFSKVIMLGTLVALLLAVSSPDWVEGYKAKKPAKLIAKGAARNFPRRWKENLINMTGRTNISDKMALASLVVVLLFSGKILLTPSYKAPQTLNMPMGDNAQRLPPRTTTAPQYDLEHIYKLGYDDAKDGKEFGTSLPKDMNIATPDELPPQSQYDDANYDWTPPPPPRRQSSFGMGTMLSMLTLYRFGKDLVTSPDGSLVMDPMYVMARVKGMEPWRLGMLAMSLYRVVTALSSLVR